MIQIQLSEKDIRSFPQGVTGAEVAESISLSLRKKAIAVSWQDQIRDLNRPLEQDGQLRILTPDDPESLEVLRHSAAHLLAEA